MTGIYALYPDDVSAQQGVDRLRTVGVAEKDIVVMSAAPLEHVASGRAAGGMSPSVLWWAASLGGLLGLAGGTWLTRTTQTAWPLTTGNMPIVSWWTNLIVMFELTMLGAIAATVSAFVVGAGLLRSRPALYDSAVSQGQILVGVERLDRPAADLRGALDTPAALAVREVGAVGHGSD